MKIGIEVEGRLRGVHTLFVSAEYILHNAHTVQIALRDHSIQHLYISDRENRIRYSSLEDWSHVLITLDITKYRRDLNDTQTALVVPPDNVTIILTLPYSYWDSIAFLRPTDQVKFHSDSRHVLCAPIQNFVRTEPSEFLGDQEI